jgi:hypothetical protein
MLVLDILVGASLLFMVVLFAQLQQISSAIMRVTHQLEELGAPLELRDGKLVAIRKNATP